MQINEETCKLAVVKSLENSQELFNDAELLFQNRRRNRAYALYVLAMEEIGKCDVCISILCLRLFHDKEALKKLQFVFKYHESKLEHSNVIDLIVIRVLLPRYPEISRKKANELLKYEVKAKNLNELKKKSLYTYYENNSFHSPSDYISVEDVEAVRLDAANRIKIVEDLWNFVLEHYDEMREYRISRQELDVEDQTEWLKNFLTD